MVPAGEDESPLQLRFWAFDKSAWHSKQAAQVGFARRCGLYIRYLDFKLRGKGIVDEYHGAARQHTKI